MIDVHVDCSLIYKRRYGAVGLKKECVVLFMEDV